MANIKRRLILALNAINICVFSAHTLPAGATLSGQVKNSAGQPQMGAVIEVFTTAALNPVTTFTDAKGNYTVSGLAPGTYFVKASATQFLPSLRENVSLRTGSSVVVNLTLNTLLEAFQLIPPRTINTA